MCTLLGRLLQCLEIHHTGKEKDSLYINAQEHDQTTKRPMFDRSKTGMQVPRVLASSAIFSGPSWGCVMTELEEIAITATPFGATS